MPPIPGPKTTKVWDFWRGVFDFQSMILDLKWFLPGEKTGRLNNQNKNKKPIDTPLHVA